MKIPQEPDDDNRKRKSISFFNTSETDKSQKDSSSKSETKAVEPLKYSSSNLTLKDGAVIEIEHNRPRFINVETSPSHYEQVPLKLFEERNNLIWIEGLVIPQYLQPILFKEHGGIYQDKSEKSVVMIKLIDNYLHNIDENVSRFRICHSKDIGNYPKTNRLVKKGEIISLYAGELNIDIKGHPPQPSEHSLNCHVLIKIKDALKDKNGYVDAKNYGNFARYMPTLPLAQSLDSAKLPGIDKTNIATENVEYDTVFYQGVYVVVFTAKHDIPEGHVFGFSYNHLENDLFSDGTWCLVTHEGKTVATVKYEDEKIVKVDTPDIHLEPKSMGSSMS